MHLTLLGTFHFGNLKIGGKIALLTPIFFFKLYLAIVLVSQGKWNFWAGSQNRAEKAKKQFSGKRKFLINERADFKTLRD